MINTSGAAAVPKHPKRSDTSFASGDERHLELKSQKFRGWFSPWSSSRAKRACDVVVAIPAIAALAPVMIAIAVAVKMDSAGPVLFRQRRSGSGGTPFTILKFRTMRADSARKGPLVTKDGDKRLTSVGRLIRRYKLDELPQLFNVIRGEMSFVGPRPKVPRHQNTPLAYRPGITGAATQIFRNEEGILRHVPDEYLDVFQMNVLTPMKTDLDRRYMERATFFSDLKLILCTVFGISSSPEKSRVESDLREQVRRGSYNHLLTSEANSRPTAVGK